MRSRTLAILLAAAVLALAGGWYFGTATTPDEQTTVARGQLMFPDLAAKLQQAARLEITNQGKQTVIEKRPDGVWGIASMHDYPVQEAKLRGLLTGLTELRLSEPRTSDPAQFSRLGLDDPNAANSAANLLQATDAAGQPILAVIVGHRRVRGQANMPEQVYVRRPGDNQTWLAEGTLQVDADPATWLNRDIMNIPASRIASVTVANDNLAFARADGKFILTQPADHPKLEEAKVEDVARGLETLTLMAVKPDAEAPGQQAGVSTFATADGLAVQVTLLHADKDIWARFAASAASDKAKPEADRLNARLAGWTYQIGTWKEKSLMPTIDELKAPEPAGQQPGAPDSAEPAQSLPAAAPDAHPK